MFTPLKNTTLHDLLNINYFCSKEIMVDNVSRELDDLKDIDIITFDIIILQAYIYYAQRNDNSNSKGLREMIANTLIHREYTSPSQARFVIERNRMYIAKERH